MVPGSPKAGQHFFFCVTGCFVFTPLYLLAFPLGLAHLLYTNRRDQAPLHHGEIVAILIFGLINFPLPSKLVGTLEFFPTNVPSWSLFYELVANPSTWPVASLLRSQQTYACHLRCRLAADSDLNA